MKSFGVHFRPTTWGLCERPRYPIHNNRKRGIMAYERRGMYRFPIFAVLLTAGLTFAEPPKGSPGKPTPEEASNFAALTKGMKGKVIWSTSRDGNHDIYIMNVDGTDMKPLTKGPKTDWY